MSTIQIYDGAKQSRPEIFWGEIAPCQHLMQIYQDDDVFMGALEGFVADGLQRGDAVIAIATPPHLTALEERLRLRGISLSIAKASEQYIPLDAEETLATFMVNGWPDEELFERCISELVVRARQEGRRVRAFGEMVAVMWARGLMAATVHLEFLWQRLCTKEMFSLLCAYPKSGFTEDAETSIKEICATHSHVLVA